MIFRKKRRGILKYKGQVFYRDYLTGQRTPVSAEDAKFVITVKELERVDNRSRVKVTRVSGPHAKEVFDAIANEVPEWIETKGVDWIDA